MNDPALDPLPGRRMGHPHRVDDNFRRVRAELTGQGLVTHPGGKTRPTGAFW